MTDVASRTLELLTLLQSQQEWGGSALARRLEVTDRTIRRDMLRLRESGDPVNAGKGPGGFYRMAPGGLLAAFYADFVVEAPPELIEPTRGVAQRLAVATGGVPDRAPVTSRG